MVIKNEINVPLIKWHTNDWGEIPADLEENKMGSI